MRIDANEIDFGDDYIYRLNGTPFSGIAFELDDRGNLLSELSFQDGSQTGSTKEWAANGTLVYDCCYLNGTKHGLQRRWSDGKLVSEEVFEYGICVSRKCWDENGNLTEDFNLEQTDPNYSLLNAIRSVIK
jgi:hypothetical protein